MTTTQEFTGGTVATDDRGSTDAFPRGQVRLPTFTAESSSKLSARTGFTIYEMVYLT
jgi:hypothetical protein